MNGMSQSEPPPLPVRDGPPQTQLHHTSNLPDDPMATLAEDLRVASSRGQLQLVRDLLAAGADLSPDKDGRTALHYAAQEGHSDTCCLLLDAGCGFDSQDASGYSPLLRAASQGALEVLKLLLHAGSRINLQDEHGNAAIHEACWNGFSKAAELLLQNSCDVCLTNKAGFTALHLAAQNGHNESSRVLLYAGCNPDIKNNYGDTALHTAARYGHAGVARILISARCLLSEQNKNGDSALHIAAALKRRKIAKILVESGTDVELVNKQNETAMDVARRKEHPEVMLIISTYKKARQAATPPHPNHHAVTFNENIEMVDGPEVKVDESRSPTKQNNTRPEKEKKAGFFFSFKRKKKDKDKDKASSAPVTPTTSTQKAVAGTGQGHDTDPNNTPATSAVHGFFSRYVPREGVQFYRDLAGNIKQGPIGYAPVCQCGPSLRHLESTLTSTKDRLHQRIDASHHILSQRIDDIDQRIRPHYFNDVGGRKGGYATDSALHHRSYREHNHHNHHHGMTGHHRMHEDDDDDDNLSDLSSDERRRSCDISDAGIDMPDDIEYWLSDKLASYGHCLNHHHDDSALPPRNLFADFPHSALANGRLVRSRSDETLSASDYSGKFRKRDFYASRQAAMQQIRGWELPTKTGRMGGASRPSRRDKTDATPASQRVVVNGQDTLGGNRVITQAQVHHQIVPERSIIKPNLASRLIGQPVHSEQKIVTKPGDLSGLSRSRDGIRSEHHEVGDGRFPEDSHSFGQIKPPYKQPPQYQHQGTADQRQLQQFHSQHIQHNGEGVSGSREKSGDRQVPSSHRLGLTRYQDNFGVHYNRSRTMSTDSILEENYEVSDKLSPPPPVMPRSRSVDNTLEDTRPISQWPSPYSSGYATDTAANAATVKTPISSINSPRGNGRVTHSLSPAPRAATRYRLTPQAYDDTNNRQSPRVVVDSHCRSSASNRSTPSDLSRTSLPASQGSGRLETFSRSLKSPDHHHPTLQPSPSLGPADHLIPTKEDSTCSSNQDSGYGPDKRPIHVRRQAGGDISIGTPSSSFSMERSNTPSTAGSPFPVQRVDNTPNTVLNSAQGVQHTPNTQYHTERRDNGENYMDMSYFRKSSDADNGHVSPRYPSHNLGQQEGSKNYDTYTSVQPNASHLLPYAQTTRAFQSGPSVRHSSPSPSSMNHHPQQFNSNQHQRSQHSNSPQNLQTFNSSRIPYKPYSHNLNNDHQNVSYNDSNRALAHQNNGSCSQTVNSGSNRPNQSSQQHNLSPSPQNPSYTAGAVTHNPQHRSMPESSQQFNTRITPQRQQQYISNNATHYSSLQSGTQVANNMRHLNSTNTPHTLNQSNTTNMHQKPQQTQTGLATPETVSQPSSGGRPYSQHYEDTDIEPIYSTPSKNKYPDNQFNSSNNTHTNPPRDGRSRVGPTPPPKPNLVRPNYINNSGSSNTDYQQSPRPNQAGPTNQMTASVVQNHVQGWYQKKLLEAAQRLRQSEGYSSFSTSSSSPSYNNDRTNISSHSGTPRVPQYQTQSQSMVINSERLSGDSSVPTQPTNSSHNSGNLLSHPSRIPPTTPHNQHPPQDNYPRQQSQTYKLHDSNAQPFHHQDTNPTPPYNRTLPNYHHPQSHVPESVSQSSTSSDPHSSPSPQKTFRQPYNTQHHQQSRDYQPSSFNNSNNTFHQAQQRNQQNYTSDSTNNYSYVNNHAKQSMPNTSIAGASNPARYDMQNNNQSYSPYSAMLNRVAGNPVRYDPIHGSDV